VVVAALLCACLSPDVGVYGMVHRGQARNSVGMQMVEVPAGRFVMGSDEGLWLHRPAHRVRLLSPFRISAAEVTVEQYRLFRPDADVRNVQGAAAGVTWHDAQAFCEWLSRREGKPYRLPTEAEWEYVCRSADRLGVRSMRSAPLEWCWDWFGEYAYGDLTDPVGPDAGVARVVRGGTLDTRDTAYRFVPDEEYERPWQRAGMPPSFGILPGAGKPGAQSLTPGLIGVWYGSSNFSRPQTQDGFPDGQRDWTQDSIRGNDWSAEWHGLLAAELSGLTRFEAEGEGRVWLTVDGQSVLSEDARRADIELTAGKAHRIVLRYSHRGGASVLRLLWTPPASARAPIPASALSHDEASAARAAAALPGGVDDGPGRHVIGFRVVQAPEPATRPAAAEVGFARQGVRAPGAWVRQGPDAAQPYFRRRPALPTPPETDARPEYQTTIDAVGLHPSFRGHNHSPALEVCENGDVLAVYYTSYREYEPEVSFIAARLRFGADEWDMPSPFLDLPSANDHAPLLWSDDGVLRLFWGSPKLAAGGFPFQWTESRDCGATWGEVRFPRFSGKVGPHSRQPINSAFRDAVGAMRLSSDAAGSTSVLWSGGHDGSLWSDPGGRTAGRHTAFCALAGGRILGMGGKNSDIEGCMPRAITDDGGRTWHVDRSSFSAQGGNQRPSLLRLASGRLFFAADLQCTGGRQPAGAAQTGSFVALSDDEGQTWHVKRLPGALPHEDGPGFFGGLTGATTLGYSVARQAPNGVIHLLTTMTRPCQHFEMNERWILSGDAAVADGDLWHPEATVGQVSVREQRDANGQLRLRWATGRGTDGRPLLHGKENWYYPDGSRQYEATWRFGRKVGVETYWSRSGRREWAWRRGADGRAVWTQWWDNGRCRSRSEWEGFRAVGTARLYDRRGRLIQERVMGG